MNLKNNDIHNNCFTETKYFYYRCLRYVIYVSDNTHIIYKHFVQLSDYNYFLNKKNMSSFKLSHQLINNNVNKQQLMT